MSFAMIALGGATAISFAGTYMAYQANQQAADAAESAAKYNAEVKRNEAIRESQVAEENIRRKSRENSRIIAEQRAAIADRGLSLEGTPLAVLGDTATTLERDIADMSWEASNKVSSLIEGAKIDRWEGGQTAASLRTKANAAALSGFSSAITGFGRGAGYIS